MRYTFLVLLLTLSLGALVAGEMAMGDAQRLLKDEKADAHALFSLSFFFEQAGRSFSALRAIERAIEKNGDVPGFHARYGQLLASRRRLKEAAAAYGKAAEMDKTAKAFRAAQARAHAQAGQLKEAIAAWQILLDGTTDRKEVLDAARQIADLAYRSQAPADAETAWKTALGKLKDWNDRYQASSEIARSIIAQRAPERAFAFWKTVFDNETDWHKRTTLADQLVQSVNTAVPDQQRKLLTEAAKLREALIGTAPDDVCKQIATRSTVDVLLRLGQPKRAAELLKPVLYNGSWDENFRTVQLLSRTYVQLDQDAARKALWKEFIQKTDQPLKLQAGKRYPIKVEFFNGAGPGTMRLLWSCPGLRKGVVPTASLFAAENAKEAQGLKAEYFGSINLSRHRFERLDPKLDFQWSETEGPDPKVGTANYSARWTGFIEAPKSADYNFYTVSDDGIRVWLDGKCIIDNWSHHGPTEDSSTDQRRLFAAWQQLAATAKDRDERIAIWQRMVTEHPDHAEARHQLAEAYAGAQQYAKAVSVYEKLISVLRQKPGHEQTAERNHWRRMVTLCAQAGQPEKAVTLMKELFGAAENYYEAHRWFSYLQNHCGRFTALKAAEDVAHKVGGVRAVGAADYLYSAGHPETARPLFDQLAKETGLKEELRKFALERLRDMARCPEERTEIARRILALTTEYYDKSRAFRQLAQCLAIEGRVADALDVVRQADGHRRKGRSSSSGPRTLDYLGSHILQGNRVGPGLRTPAGQEQAEKAFEGFYKAFSSRREYRSALNRVATPLSELHARRGDYEGAVQFLAALSNIQEIPSLHLQRASLLERSEDAKGAFDAHFEYFSAMGRERARYLQGYKHRAKRSSTAGVDGRLAQYIQKTKKTEEFVQRAFDRIEKLASLEREGAADVALRIFRQLAIPEQTVDLVDRLHKWGHKPSVYSHEKQWAEAAIKMKNASSQADTRMRDQLLEQAKSWKNTLKANPEDYQAALNAYKTYRMLGRAADAEPFLKQAAKIAPKDPVILQRLGREYMLNKNYVGTVKSLAEAAQIAGRTEDFEGTMLTAFELSGRSKDALTLALDSLAQGRHHGQGIRKVEDLMDLAERTDNLEHLYKEAKRLMTETRAAKRPVRERLAQLALRLAWDNSDDAMATAALEELLRPGSGAAPVWQDQWRMNQLAQRAVERRRLKDAIAIRRAMLKGPNLSAYRQLAMLYMQIGEAPKAAELMFEGLNRAGFEQLSGTVPVPYLRRKHDDREQRSNELQWVNAILSMAAQELSAGGSDFNKACGEQLQRLVEVEMERLSKAPLRYSGPLTDSSVEGAFKLREKITQAYAAFAAKDDADADALVAYARRLANTVKVGQDGAGDGADTLKLIRKALDDAAECSTAGRQKQRVCEQAAGIYASLLGRSEKERLAGVNADLVLGAYDAAMAAGDGGMKLEILRRATDFANAQKRFDLAVKYAQNLHQQLPHDYQIRQLLAVAMLNTGQTEEAIGLVKSGLDRFSTYHHTRLAADVLMTQGPLKEDGTPERPIAVAAAAAAVELYERAIKQYLEEVGPQVDAKGRPLPNAELGRMQTQLSRASAAAGQLDRSLDQMLAAAFNLGEQMREDVLLRQLAKAYTKADRIDDLISRLEEKVAAEPKKVSFRLALATVMEEAGKWEQAAKALLAARTLDADLTTVKRLIKALCEAGNYEGALEQCHGWAESFPRDAEAYRTMADIYKELKDEHGEIRSLTMLVEVSPRDAVNCREVAVLFAGRKQYKRAIALLERAVEIRGEEPYRHVDLAEVCLLSGDAQRAATILKDCLSRDWEKGLSPELLARMPDWRGTYETRAHSLLAEAYDAQELKDEAAKERLNVPNGYKRPALKDAVPTPRRPRWWGGRIARWR